MQAKVASKDAFEDKMMIHLKTNQYWHILERIKKKRGFQNMKFINDPKLHIYKWIIFSHFIKHRPAISK